MTDDAAPGSEPEVVYLRSRVAQLEQRIRELEIDRIAVDKHVTELLGELALERARL